jgi:hypothetical protein
VTDHIDCIDGPKFNCPAPHEHLCDHVGQVVIVSFMTKLLLWITYFVAQEIEDPLGSDENILPLKLMQTSLNRSLVSFMWRSSQLAPQFELNEDKDRTFPFNHLERWPRGLGTHMGHQSGCEVSILD